MDRELCGIYFRVKRDDKWQPICFSDLTDKEMEDVLKDKSNAFLKMLCMDLGKVIREIGEELEMSVDY